MKKTKPHTNSACRTGKRPPCRKAGSGREGEQEACLKRFTEDASEKRLRERPFQVTQKMEAVGRLSGGTAHDFINLFGVMIGYRQVLKKKRNVADPLREHAETIEKAAQCAALFTR
ncbi:MAG TPA: hypothetical protein VNV41_08175 [Candidatus Acidoferrales bacterium]|nr:hypothetical protein [Candidatus Acidoferrales bacterium]